jgi:hypothetical protein
VLPRPGWVLPLRSTVTPWGRQGLLPRPVKPGRCRSISRSRFTRIRGLQHAQRFGGTKGHGERSGGRRSCARIDTSTSLLASHLRRQVSGLTGKEPWERAAEGRRCHLDMTGGITDEGSLFWKAFAEGLDRCRAPISAGCAMSPATVASRLEGPCLSVGKSACILE